MTSKKNLETGDLVKVVAGSASGCVGVVTRPVTEQARGHVHIHKDRYIQGLDISQEDVLEVDRHAEGFAQLAYNLVKLGSHVIEQKLL